MKYRLFVAVAVAALVGFSSVGYPQEQANKAPASIANYVGNWDSKVKAGGETFITTFQITADGQCRHRRVPTDFVAWKPCDVNAQGQLVYDTSTDKGTPLKVTLIASGSRIVGGQAVAERYSLTLEEFKRLQ